MEGTNATHDPIAGIPCGTDRVSLHFFALTRKCAQQHPPLSNAFRACCYTKLGFYRNQGYNIPYLKCVNWLALQTDLTSYFGVIHNETNTPAE
jgi:hypothetical protein